MLREKTTIKVWAAFGEDSALFVRGKSSTQEECEASMYELSVIAERVNAVRARIAAACERVGRAPEEVRIVAVSKTHPPEALLAAWQAGIREFGENRVQEAAPKFSQVTALLPEGRQEGLRFHMVGHLQTNKAKQAVALFDLLHSVDSTKLADEIEKWSGRTERSIDVLIQVNVSGETSKSGIPPSEVPELVRHVLEECPHIVIQGYMTIAPIVADPEEARPFFAELRKLRDELGEVFSSHECYLGRELSMGMTGDYQVAVEEGATLVRIGTAIFGAR